ncbi:MAG: DALR domain-containing protein, partial [Myxococcota bacterium]
LNMGSEKMSKSTGNMKTLSSLTAQGLDPMAFRYFFLQAHYRQQQSFGSAALEAAAKGLRRLRKIAFALEATEGEGSSEVQAPFKQRFRDALADDLNAPRAMAVLWEVARSDVLGAADRRDLLRGFDRVLGLRLADSESLQKDPEWQQDPKIDGMLMARQAARAAKDWALADQIRDELSEMKIEIVDTPDGPRWRRFRRDPE